MTLNGDEAAACEDEDSEEDEKGYIKKILNSESNWIHVIILYEIARKYGNNELQKPNTATNFIFMECIIY